MNSQKKERSHSRLVVINADDFGFSQGVNQAIIKAYQQGILTSTSLMVTGAAFEEAVTLAKANPNLAVGLHLVVIKGRSVLPHSQIPNLVDVDSNFSNDPFKAGVNYYFNSAARQELKLEIRTQLEKFRQTGLQLSHVDGHKHLHCHPVVLNILSELAEEFNIKFIRLPIEELKLNLTIDQKDLFSKLIWSWVFGRLRSYGEKLLRQKKINFTERVYGLLQTGRMSEDYLISLIPQIQADFIEIYSHPSIAIADQPKTKLGEAELHALLSEKVKNALTSAGFELTNFHKIKPHP